ncbi:MAG: HEAT repeat domain-containing protein, partial [Deltaproteobacteria bacterium]|nr:HEAT repeat domain-containing protein [Deltaproteobacteria bacterium]
INLTRLPENREMKCEEIQGLLTEYIDNFLDEKDRILVYEHLSSCEACSRKVEEIESLFLDLKDIELEEPSENLRNSFYNMINSYTLGMGNRIKLPLHEKALKWIDSWWPQRPAVQFAVTMSVLIIGLATGLKMNMKNESEKEIVQLKTDVNQMRQTIMSSLLNQSSVTERINGLTMTSRLENVDSQFLSTLLLLLNSDSDVNVRLAAINALSKYADNEYVRQELVKSLGLQSSPLVQVSLIDLLSSIQAYDSYPTLMRMIEDPETDDPVKKRAKKALTRLVSYENSI